MITIATILESLRSLKDKTWKVTFETNELTPQQIGAMSELQSEFCYLAIKKEPFKSKELDDLNQIRADFDDQQKSQSQRLRAVFYRLWEQSDEGYEDFELYYRFKMDKVINHYKGFLK